MLPRRRFIRRIAAWQDGYGFLRQRPMAGPLPHLAPSDAPPDGQNTDTRVSPASQLTSPLA
jgi:hypothetical protein